MHLDQPRVGAVALGVSPIAARTSSIVSRVRLSGLATKSKSAGSAISSASLRPLRDGLRAAERVEGDVGLALQPVLGVPVGLAVTHEIDKRKHAEPMRLAEATGQSLIVEMSGASTAFMPTTW